MSVRSGTITVSGGVMNLNGGTIGVSGSGEMKLRGGTTTISGGTMKLYGGTTTLSNSAIVNLTGGMMKITKGTLNIKNNNFSMSDSGILNLLDMTDFSKISGKINMTNMNAGSLSGVHVQYRDGFDSSNSANNLFNLTGSGDVYVFPKINVDDESKIITVSGVNDVRKYVTDTLKFKIGESIKVKHRYDASQLFNYIVSLATDVSGSKLNSEKYKDYVLDLDSFKSLYNQPCMTITIDTPITVYFGLKGNSGN